MTKPDATDEKPMDGELRATWTSFRERYDLHVRSPIAIAKLEVAVAAFKLGQALGRARVVKELRAQLARKRGEFPDELWVTGMCDWMSTELDEIEAA